MSDYIKRDNTLKAMDTWDKFGCDGHGRLVPYTEEYVPYVKFDDMLKAVKGQPSADVVPVVRCKDCKFAHMTYGGECKYCDVWESEESLYLDGDFFCAFGERKDNG